MFSNSCTDQPIFTSTCHPPCNLCAWLLYCLVTHGTKYENCKFCKLLILGKMANVNVVRKVTPLKLFHKKLAHNIRTYVHKYIYAWLTYINKFPFPLSITSNHTQFLYLNLASPMSSGSPFSTIRIFSIILHAHGHNLGRTSCCCCY